jgi:hypothetical protein
MGTPSFPRPGEITARTFDVRGLSGETPAPDGFTSFESGPSLDQKLRDAYGWIVSQALVGPVLDLELSDVPPTSFHFDGAGTDVRLPGDASYASFVLLPLLSLVLRKRCLIVGGPGRGKSACATLMALLAGHSLKDVRAGLKAASGGRAEATVSDADWRAWLRMRAKIVDPWEPARISDRLRAAMEWTAAEADDFDEPVPESAWFFVAGDAGAPIYDIGPRSGFIDVTVRAPEFNPRFLSALLSRVEGNRPPEASLPWEIIFTDVELDTMRRQALALPVPPPIRRRIEYFASQFAFCDLAGEDLEAKQKDHLKLAGTTIGQICERECGRDKAVALCSQTENGLSAETLMTLLGFIKAAAWFRGAGEVSLADARAITPWILHEKLVQNPGSPFFAQPRNDFYLVDRIAWLRRLFDLACEDYDQHGLDADDPVARLDAELEGGVDGLSDLELQQHLATIESEITRLASTGPLLAHVHGALLRLKSHHQRCLVKLNTRARAGS